MILTDDDDDDSVSIIEIKSVPRIVTEENTAPSKPAICTFFKPKVNLNLVTNNTKQSSGIFEKIEQSICYDIKHDYHDYKLHKIQAGYCQNSPTNLNSYLNPSKFDAYKQEAVVKCEKDFQRSFSSTESSSLSNLPTISATYSKSTKSFSDSDNQDHLDNSTNSLIVKNVYSLCKEKSTISTRSSDTNKSIPLHTCIKSRDNSITIVRKSIPAIKTLQKLSPNRSPKKTSNKSKAASSKKKSSKSAEETLQRINDVFKLVKQQPQTKAINKSFLEINDTQSMSSEASTVAMIEDVDDFDLVPVNYQSQYSLMQPIILIEPLQFDKNSPYKRIINNSNCRNSSEPLNKKLKRHRSFGLNDSANITVHDKFDVKKIDDESESVKTEKAVLSYDSLFKERNNSHNKVLYHSMTDLVENDIIYCFVCKKYSNTMCKFHPVTWIPNENIDCPYVEYFINGSFEKYFNNNSEKELCKCNQNELDHIQISLPKMFQLKESVDSEIGIWTKQKLKQGSIIGPYLGEIIENWKSKMPIRCPYNTRRLLKSGTYDELHCLEFAFKSNWLRCINFTNDDELANLKVLRYDEKIFFQSTKEIHINTELLVCNKFDFGTIKLKKNPDFKMNNSVSIDRNIPDKMFPSSQDVHVDSDDAKYVPYQGHKYSKALIEEIANIWKRDSQKSVSEALTILESQYPEVREINVKSFAKLLSQLQLRPRDVFLSNTDDETIDYISELLIRNPSLMSSQISQLICKKFPHKSPLNILCINQIITRLKLRPLRGMDDDNIDRETVQEIVELFTNDKRLTLEEAQKRLTKMFPMKPKLNFQIIDKIAKLNYCRISDEKNNFRVEKYLLKEVNKLVKNGDWSKEIIYGKIKQKFPKKEIVTLPYIEFLVGKCSGSLPRKDNSSGIKCDEEMNSFILKLHLDHPEYSATKINEQLRDLLPDRPYICRNTVSKKIRRFRSANQ